MTAPQARPGGLDANARGLIVIVVAVVIAALLLLKGGGGGTPEKVATGTSSGSTTTITISEGTTPIGGDTTTTTAAGGSAHKPSEVSVIVLNGSGKTGVAASWSTTLGNNHGYTMQDPGNAAANTPTTTVYYATGYQADANAVASALGKTASIVKPKPTTSLGSTTGGANTRANSSNVVVVLGADTPNVSGGTSGSTTTTTTG
jgi:hypothetical protein